MSTFLISKYLLSTIHSLPMHITTLLSSISLTILFRHPSTISFPTHLPFPTPFVSLMSFPRNRKSCVHDRLHAHSPMSSLIPFIYYSSNSDKWPMHAWSFWLLQKPSTDVFPFPNSLYLPILPPLHSKLMNPLNPETGSVVETVQERLRGCHQ